MNSTTVGDALEESIFHLFRAEIDAGRFWAKKTCCKVYRRKGYFSKDRNSQIVFDVSIEIFLPGATEFSTLVLIECKNYSSAVPVDDAEEFFSKVQQVAAANCKAIIASTAAFQSGAREFCKSKGIGLLRYFGGEDFKWDLKRSPSAGARTAATEKEAQVELGLTSPEYHSELFDLYLQSPSRLTNSLWDFFGDVIATSNLSETAIRRIANSRDRISNLVPFRERGELETIAERALETTDYVNGAVSLDALCEYEARRSGLTVCKGIERAATGPLANALGCIEFDPLHINIFDSGHFNASRDRFTLAHELGHHLLGHGQFIWREYCDESDLGLSRRVLGDGTDIARMEYQANYFASCLLMPRNNFARDFWLAAQSLDLRNNGFGRLYVDDQPCNVQVFRAILDPLTRKYQVSQFAATIRLEGLGLIQDARTEHLKSVRHSLVSVVDAVLNSFDDSAA